MLHKQQAGQGQASSELSCTAASVGLCKQLWNRLLLAGMLSKCSDSQHGEGGHVCVVLWNLHHEVVVAGIAACAQWQGVSRDAAAWRMSGKSERMRPIHMQDN